MRQDDCAPCRIWIPQPNSAQGATAHAGYYDPFSVCKPVSGWHHDASTRPGERGDARDERPRDDEGDCALGWQRRELSDDPTFFHDQPELGQGSMGTDSPPSLRPTVSPLL